MRRPMISTLLPAFAAFSSPLRALGGAAVARPGPAFFELADRPTMAVAWPTPLHAAQQRTSTVAMKMFQPNDPCNGYAVLGLKPGATSKEIKRAYREHAKKCHPDLNPSSAAAAEFQRITAVRDRPARLLTERRPRPILDLASSPSPSLQPLHRPLHHAVSSASARHLGPLSPSGSRPLHFPPPALASHTHTHARPAPVSRGAGVRAAHQRHHQRQDAHPNPTHHPARQGTVPRGASGRSVEGGGGAGGGIFASGASQRRERRLRRHVSGGAGRGAGGLTGGVPC